jgi:DNA-binding MarR family transcriptional regulator
VTVDRAAEIIQFAYPQIYFACHTRHARARSGPATLSGRDAQVLAHLDRDQPTTVTTLARHMGLAASTLSEAVKQLAALGYVDKARRLDGDRRQVGLILTQKGIRAVRSSSVLETPRLNRVLRRLAPADRARVADALDLFAAACRPKGYRS